MELNYQFYVVQSSGKCEIEKMNYTKTLYLMYSLQVSDDGEYKFLKHIL